MDAEEALFTALSAEYTNDTGAGGLNGSGSAKITAMLRFGNAKRTQNWPYVTVEIDTQDVTPFGTGSNPTVLANIRFHIWTNRDNQNLTVQNAVRYRMRRLFNRKKMNSQTVTGATWAFAPLEMVGGGQQVPDPKVNHFVLPCSATLTGTLT